MNYIRNSVKAVVDMYDGTVSFYAMDSKDPVLAMYERAFPGVFKDLTDLPADLKAHLRYPCLLYTSRVGRAGDSSTSFLPLSSLIQNTP